MIKMNLDFLVCLFFVFHMTMTFSIKFLMASYCHTPTSLIESLAWVLHWFVLISVGNKVGITSMNSFGIMASLLLNCLIVPNWLFLRSYKHRAFSQPSDAIPVIKWWYSVYGNRANVATSIVTNIHMNITIRIQESANSEWVGNLK